MMVLTLLSIKGAGLDAMAGSTDHKCRDTQCYIANVHASQHSYFNDLAHFGT